jgi:hypothetical protein
MSFATENYKRRFNLSDEELAQYLKDLRTIELSPQGLRDADPDTLAVLMEIRPREVEVVMDSEQRAAERAERQQQDDIAVFYAECRAGKHSAREFNDWFETHFKGDFNRFAANFPGIDGGPATYNANLDAISKDMLARNVLPIYDEWAESYRRLVYAGSLYIKCPDGKARTGYELQQAVRQWPLELLEPNPPKTADDLSALSADDYMRRAGLLTQGDLVQQRLDQELYEREWRAFLTTAEGRAFETVRAQITDRSGIDPFPKLIHQYLADNNLPPSSGAFREAAVEAAKQFSVQLTFEHSGMVGYGSTVVSDQGGDRRSGSGAVRPFNPSSSYSLEDCRRICRELDAVALDEKLRMDSAFAKALDTFGAHAFR